MKFRTTLEPRGCRVLRAVVVALGCAASPFVLAGNVWAATTDQGVRQAQGVSGVTRSDAGTDQDLQQNQAQANSQGNSQASSQAGAQGSASASAQSRSGNGSAPSGVSIYRETEGVVTPGRVVQGTTTIQGQGTGTQGEAAMSKLDQVVSKLAADPQLKGADIRVSVEQGKVTLRGKTTDASQAQHAEQVAQQAAGNAQVVNDLMQ